MANTTDGKYFHIMIGRMHKIWIIHGNPKVFEHFHINLTAITCHCWNNYTTVAAAAAVADVY